VVGRFAGQVALVTGAASGIGAAIVRQLCAEGAQVCAAGLQPDLLVTLARECGASALSCDVTDDVAVRAVVGGVVQTHKRLDILVNAAGVVHNDDAADIDDAHWQRMLDINLSGSMRVCRAALPVMQSQRCGAIVNIASVAAFNASAGMASYSASKAGLVAFTRSIANRYGAEGIRANCLAPGWVRTPMSEEEMRAVASAEGIGIDAAFERLTGRIALGRIGTAAEMAECALCLASKAAAFVTGAVLVADGGARTPAAARAC
jgi:NAD(P)-dependent dehydrogenase (short-subunit alcohol dehydrogenase family)